MQYAIKKEIIPRNIAKRYFLVDITAKDYYDQKRIYSTNECGYTLFIIMKSLSAPFSVPTLTSELIKQISDYRDDLYPVIASDIASFLKELTDIGYIEEVSET